MHMMHSRLSLFLGLCIQVSLIRARITVTTSLHHDVVKYAHDAQQTFPFPGVVHSGVTYSCKNYCDNQFAS